MELSEYKEEFKDAIIELLSQRHGSSYKKWKSNIWEWCFVKNPFITDQSSIIVAIEDNKIIGSNASLPVMLKYKNKKLEALWSCDTILNPSHRGKGYGKKLFQAIQTRRPVVMGLGISDMADPVLKKNGWKVNHEIEIYFYGNQAKNLKNFIEKAFKGC